MSGHSVLQLPVVALEGWVRARTAHYDGGFVSTDPGFGHAHITVLGPFDPAPSTSVLSSVAEIAGATAPMTVRLEELAQFPNGIIHLVPSPADPLRALTARLVAAFPSHPPYGRDFGSDVQPHLTVDAASELITISSTRELLAGVVPVTCVLDRLQLAWWESGGCHVIAEWALGG